MTQKIVKARWYVVHVYSGFEKKVADQIAIDADEKGLSHFFEDVICPSEQVIEVRRGVKVEAERNLFPGYILVKMIMTNDSWHLVSSLPRVTGFLGGTKKPTPISNAEAKRMLQQVEEGATATRLDISFEIGERVKVLDGPLASFEGVVDDVNEAEKKLKVSVAIFGRNTPVELSYEQVEKV